MSIMNNYHTHTYRCRHARGTEEEMILSAMEKGFQEIGISDHIPLPYFRWHLLRALPHSLKNMHSLLSWCKSFIYNGPGMRMPYREKKAYITQLNELQKKYSGKIVVYKGFECEYFRDYLPYYRQLLADQEVDYLIFGHHFHQFSVSSAYYGRQKLKKEDLLNYVDEAIEAMETGLFRYFAHPDLIFIGYPYWDDFVEGQMRRLIRCARDHQVVLEVNAGGLRRKKIQINDRICPPYPLDEFWCLAAELNAKAIIGLDAHDPSQLDLWHYQKLEAFCDKHQLSIVRKLSEIV